MRDPDMDDDPVALVDPEMDDDDLVAVPLAEPEPLPARVLRLVAPSETVETVPGSRCRYCRKVGTRIVNSYGDGLRDDYCGVCGKNWPA